MEITTLAIVISFLSYYADEGHNVSNLNRQEVICLADNIYHEAGNQSQMGMRAVAHVTMNRVRSNRYPNSICGVIKQGYKPGKTKGCQFSWYCDGKSDNIYFKDKNGNLIKGNYKAYKLATMEAIFSLMNWTDDPVYGAHLYYAHDIVTPNWAHHPKYEVTVVIEDHTFMGFIPINTASIE